MKNEFSPFKYTGVRIAVLISLMWLFSYIFFMWMYPAASWARIPVITWSQVFLVVFGIIISFFAFDHRKK